MSTRNMKEIDWIMEAGTGNERGKRDTKLPDVLRESNPSATSNAAY